MNSVSLASKALGIFLLSFFSLGLQAADVTKEINQVIETAETYLGTRHRMGGLSRKGIDCSGLMVVSFKTAKEQLPRTALEQSKFGKKIGQSNLRRGDMVFFKTQKRNRGKINHVGLVISVTGDDVWFIHTSSSKGVMISQLSNPYWHNAYQYGRRVFRGRLEETPGPFAFASERPLSSSELISLSRKDRTLIAEAILARNGYLFPEKSTFKRYQRQKWYRRMAKNRNIRAVVRDMSQVEQDNLTLLQHDQLLAQRKRKQRSRQVQP